MAEDAAEQHNKVPLDSQVPYNSSCLSQDSCELPQHDFPEVGTCPLLLEYQPSPNSTSLSRSDFTFLAQCIGTEAGVWTANGLALGSTCSSKGGPLGCVNKHQLLIFQKSKLVSTYQ